MFIKATHLGFIQTPILVVVLIISILTIGGTGYVAYKAGKSSSEETEPAIIKMPLDNQNTLVNQKEDHATTSTDVNRDSGDEQNELALNAAFKIEGLESEKTNLKEQVDDYADNPVVVSSERSTSELENTIRGSVTDSASYQEIVPNVQQKTEVESEFDWEFWLNQEDFLKQNKKDLNKLLDTKERTIEMYEESKDSYAKWSPLLKDTIAGDIASRGYDHVNDAIKIEEKALKIGEEYKNSINQMLDAIGLHDEASLKVAIVLSNQKLEEFKAIYDDSHAAALDAQSNLEDFNDALTSMGY